MTEGSAGRVKFRSVRLLSIRRRIIRSRRVVMGKYLLEVFLVVELFLDEAQDGA